MTKKISFEEAMNKIEEIVSKLENQTASLEETVELYKEGTELSVLCNKMIDEAEQKIKVLAITKNGLEEKDFTDNE